ncbi:MAG TPA: hypothetical protein VHA11_01445 [Bryobacteraceae bacterium]|nr:hypothetical protein [Bryobacteraceae bacterium]
MPARFGRSLPAAAVTVLLLAAGPAAATIVARLDLPELTRSSNLIVHGRVLRHWSAWDAAHRFIWTHYVVEVTESLKGAPAPAVTVTEPGGAVGPDLLRVAGAPEYSDREEVVVFLRRTPLGYWRSTGWGQGKYTVMLAPDGSRRVRTNLAGLSLAAPPAARGTRPALASPVPGRLDGMRLNEFKRLVRAQVAGKEALR